MQVHIHDWTLNGDWHCSNHLEHVPGELDAATVWWILGIIKSHYQDDQLGICKCGWVGTNFSEHIDDVVFYALREIEPKI